MIRPASLFLLLLVAAGSLGATPPAPEHPERLLGKSCPHPPSTLRETGDRGFDCLDLRLELALDFETETITGAARHRVAATAPLDTLELDLTDSLDVLGVWRGGSMSDFVHQDGKLRIVLAPPLDPGEQAELTIRYEGHPPREGLLGFAFETRDGVPAAYTLSEPMGASSWWPCKNVPDDKLTATIVLDVPDTLYAGSNGLLVADEIEQGRRRMEWRESWPIAPYLISIACTNYAIFEDLYTGIDGRDLPLLYLAYPEDLEDAQVSWARTPAMLAAFERYFGSYPFYGEKYGMAEFSWGGAMEHQTLTSYGAYAVDGTDANDWIVAHELAHQWWGNHVTLASWEEMWLNEGFARYGEAIWFGSQEGIEGYRDWIRQMWRPSFPGALVPPDYLFNSTVYLKGAWVLHMLRGILGKEVFFAALDTYSSRFAYGNAETEDLIRACEDTAGRDLRWFFDPWVYGTGRPAYLSTWELVPGVGGPELELTIEQVQVEPPFRMPIEVEIEDAEGSYLVEVEDSLRVQTFRFAVRLPPAVVRLDPNDWILKDWIGGSDVTEPAGLPPRLGAPYPSPGAPPLCIPVGTARPGTALDLYDLTGRLLRRIVLSGEETILWDGRDGAGRGLPSGVYLLRIDDGTARSSRKIWLVR